MATTRASEPRAEEWIGAEDVAAEMGLSPRAAWELIRRWGVTVTHPNSRTLARFKRSDFDAARDRNMAPPAPRRQLQRATAARAAQAPTREKRAAADFDDKLKKLKAGRA